MIEAVLFMMIIASIIVLKTLYRAKVQVQVQNETQHQEYQSWGDLQLSNIPHWCLHHNVTDCSCSNPLAPTPRFGYNTWTQAYHQNVHQAKNSKKELSSRTGTSIRNLDVVFFGDSIMEGFKGMKFGKKVGHKNDNKAVFERYFDAGKGAEFDGLIFAIAGDKVSKCCSKKYIQIMLYQLHLPGSDMKTNNSLILM